MSLRLGLDLDGCVYGFHEEFSRHMLTRYPGKDFPAPCRWEMWECWGLSKEQFVDEFYIAVEDFGVFARGKPIDGALDAVQELHSMGHSLHVVTDRGAFPSAPSDTVMWLESYGIYELISSVTFTKNKDCVKLDVLIDDYHVNCDTVMANGVDAILIDRPWNKVIDPDNHTCMMLGWDKATLEYDRAENWSDVIDKIKRRDV